MAWAVTRSPRAQDVTRGPPTLLFPAPRVWDTPSALDPRTPVPTASSFQKPLPRQCWPRGAPAGRKGIRVRSLCPAASQPPGPLLRPSPKRCPHPYPAPKRPPHGVLHELQIRFPQPSGFCSITRITIKRGRSSGDNVIIGSAVCARAPPAPRSPTMGVPARGRAAAAMLLLPCFKSQNRGSAWSLWGPTPGAERGLPPPGGFRAAPPKRPGPRSQGPRGWGLTGKQGLCRSPKGLGFGAGPTSQGGRRGEEGRHAGEGPGTAEAEAGAGGPHGRGRRGARDPRERRRRPGADPSSELPG